MGTINVGFTDLRNSSRILKPPGGGTSDIFCTGSATKVQKEVKVTVNKTEQQSTTQKIVTGNSVQEPKIENNEEIVIKTVVEEDFNKLNLDNSAEENEEFPSVTDGKEELSGESQSVDALTPKKIEPEAVVKQNVSDIIANTHNVIEHNRRPKNRIPPGGYSSGLW